MATPTSRGSPFGRLAALLKRLAANKKVYNAYLLFVLAATITLMVVPAEKMTDASDKPEINLDITFGDLSEKGWLSLAFILLGFLLMVFDLVGADLAMNLVLVLMTTFKVITIKSALAGFASGGLWTIILLMIVAQGITSTGGADYIVTKLLGTPQDTMLAQVRMCLITLVFSSFVNDTPVFCIMLPIVLTWAAKARLNIRQLLIPLSYCALLGGLNTTIGTSTNLVVTGQYDDRVLDPESEYYQEGATPIPLFGITPYGLPNGIWGIIYIVYAAPFLLVGGAGKKVFSRVARSFKKGGGAAGASTFEQGSDFWFGLLVAANSPVAGKSVADAGLRHLDGVYLTSVRHNGKVAHAVGPDYVIAAGDVLYFSGVPDSAEQLASKYGLLPFSDAVETLDASEIPNLEAAYGIGSIAVPRADSVKRPSSGKGDDLLDDCASDRSAVAGAPALELVEATIKSGAEVANRTIRASAFRSRFHASVVAIKRRGAPLEWKGQIGEEVLLEGDVLLLDVDQQFWTTPAVNENFTEIGRSGKTRTHHEFMLPMVVKGLLAGKSIQKAGLRQLPAAFLAAIERNGHTIHAVSPDEVLEEGDVLWFATAVSSVRFIRNTPGLVPLSEEHASKLRNTQFIERRLVQAVISPSSPLIGRTPAQVRFREQFNAAVVAVARQGERINSKPGDVVLRSSDILLVDAGPSFASQHKQDSKYFSLIIELANTNPPRYFHTFICVALVITAFVLYALEILDILIGGGLTVAALLLTGCLSPEQARGAIRWDVYLMIAGSFGVSAGLEQSGGAAAIANVIVSIGKNAGGDGFILATIYIATTLLSQIISNNSAAALLFPIAANISKTYGTDIKLLSYAVMLGASSVFMSSFGYQTNLMALAAGGHSSRDFLKFGTPMQIVLAVVSVVTLIAGPDNWPFVWLVTGVSGAVLLGLPQIVEWASLWRARQARRAGQIA